MMLLILVALAGFTIAAFIIAALDEVDGWWSVFLGSVILTVAWAVFWATNLINLESPSNGPQQVPLEQRIIQACDAHHGVRETNELDDESSGSYNELYITCRDGTFHRVED